jgi:phytoene dehydrogenase-like protein
LTDPPAALEPLLQRWRDKTHRDGYESKLDAVIETLPPLPHHDAAYGSELGVDQPWLPTTIVAPGLAAIEAARRAMQQGAVAAQPLFFVNVPSALDQTMRVGGATGAHVLSLEVLFTPYAFAPGWDDPREPLRWLHALATHLGHEGPIEPREWRAVTPPVYESQFHLRRGHAPSFAGGPVAALVGRAKELTRYETPIRGLFLTGAATFPGAGVWGASGRNAASVIVAPRSRVRRVVGRINPRREPLTRDASPPATAPA